MWEKLVQWYSNACSHTLSLINLFELRLAKCNSLLISWTASFVDMRILLLVLITSLLWFRVAVGTIWQFRKYCSFQICWHKNWKCCSPGNSCRYLGCCVLFLIIFFFKLWSFNKKITPRYRTRALACAISLCNRRLSTSSMVIFGDNKKVVDAFSWSDASTIDYNLHPYVGQLKILCNANELEVPGDWDSFGFDCSHEAWNIVVPKWSMNLTFNVQFRCLFFFGAG